MTSYKKSVELYPDNPSGLLAIHRMEGTLIKVDPAVLETYVGKYQVRPGVELAFTVEDGVLMGEPTGYEKGALEGLSESKFILPSVNVIVEFVKGEDGEVGSLILKQVGEESVAKKID